MQHIKNSISFTKDVIASLYSNYAKSVFHDAAAFLHKRGMLSHEEKQILIVAATKAMSIESFYRKSYIIYLSNAILWEKGIEKIKSIKKQLMLELALGILSHGLDAKVFYYNEDKDLFSLYLNRNIDAKFDSISKRDDFFIFHKNRNEILKLKKNDQCAITENVDFLDKDKNPFNEKTDHPDAPAFTPYDLRNIPKEEWVRQFRESYRTIKDKAPKIYDEIHLFLDAVVPHGYEKDKQMSSSYSKSPGILYLSYTDNDITQAEAIIHEVHHTIFNIIERIYRLANNNMELKYYSAYRPDARHIKGCFIGLHAFVAVQNFYKKLAESIKDEEIIKAFLSLYLKNAKVVSVLEKYGNFTNEGGLLFKDIKNRHFMDKSFFEKISEGYASIYSGISMEVELHLEGAKNRNNILLY